MSGSCSASWVRAARSEPCCSDARANTTASSAGRGKRAATASPGGGSPIASPTRTVPSPRTVAISPAVTASRRGAPAGAKTRIEVAFASSPPPTRTRCRGPQGAREEADVGDAFARRRAFDLEHAARHRRLGITALPHQQLVDAGEEVRDADASPRGADEDRVDVTGPRLLGERRPELGVRQAHAIGDVRVEDALVVLGEDLDERGWIRFGRSLDRDDAR